MISEGIDPSHMYLKGRGRPSRFGNMISDLMSHNRMSPESSNSDSDINHHSSLAHESTPGCDIGIIENSNGVDLKLASVHEDTVDLLSSTNPMYHNKEFNEGAESKAKLTDTNESDATSTGQTNNQQLGDDQSLSLAVEMAAVNQAILSLSGQNPINVKSEKMENLYS